MSLMKWQNLLCCGEWRNQSYNVFTPSARRVDCWACWALPAKQRAVENEEVKDSLTRQGM